MGSAANPAARPFDDVRDLALQPVVSDSTAAEQVLDALRGMGRDRDFGKLGDAAAWLAKHQCRFPPRIENATLAVFAGSHGLANKGVTLSSDEDTRSHLNALREGKAPLSAIAAQNNANIRVFELAIEKPTPCISEAAAMSEQECAATMAYGFEALEGSPDCLAIAVTGAGIGTAAAAVACALYGGQADYWVRPGPGTPSEMSSARVNLVNQALAFHRGNLGDPLEILRRLGGRELAASAGAIIACGKQGVPVVLDGFATTIAAGVVHAINAESINHVLAAHATRRPAHEAALERVGLEPLMRMEFQTGGGLGSTTALGLLRTACSPFLAKSAAVS